MATDLKIMWGGAIALAGLSVAIGFREGVVWTAVVFALIMCAGASILWMQSFVARQLGCGIRFGWRDVPGFFLMRFADPKWLICFEDTVSLRKAWVVVLSGWLAPVVTILAMWGCLELVRLSGNPTLSIHLPLGMLGALVLIYGLVDVGLCLLILAFQARDLLSWRKKDRADLLLEGWQYRLAVEFGLYQWTASEWVNILLALANERNDPKLWFLVALYLHNSDSTQAVVLYSRAYDSGGLPREVALRAADGCVTCALFSDPQPLLPKLDQYSQELLAAQPDDLSLHGTRGSVLIELGRLDEGKRMLEGVLAQDENKFDRAISAIYLAYAAHREQRPEDVARYVTLALEADAENPIFKRFAFLLPKEKTTGI